ncbi:uncharacterized protein LOC129756573 [Uranotaenia lowii]|uniref:uncharacterized protein LOC129756573 n=1 Tax=Uranotaenia lowii TaxID=190385 RepID=UPI002479FB7D|nr:uncharacterized protein LOC129756573 [Uranotaenia lowii]
MDKQSNGVACGCGGGGHRIVREAEGEGEAEEPESPAPAQGAPEAAPGMRRQGYRRLAARRPGHPIAEGPAAPGNDEIVAQPGLFLPNRRVNRGPFRFLLNRKRGRFFNPVF